MELIDSGVTAPKGFLASGIHCGIRKNKEKKDLALIMSQNLANAAAVYTTNIVKGAPLIVTKAHLVDGKARAVVCNSGIANTCVSGGEETAEKMCSIIAKQVGISPNDVIVASTGVIGMKLDLGPIEAGVEKLVDSLGKNGTDAAEAIMTTDTVSKEAAVSFTIGGRNAYIGGMAKGSGMIHPNMATMLVFLTTDVSISSEMLQTAISEDVKSSFNMVSVDGDTSTNDMLVILANGAASNAEICEKGPQFDTFCEALSLVTRRLCRMIAKDGEGATKLLECRVSGANSVETARKTAKSVISSSLFKAAMFGEDANWGRVLCAVGYSGANVDADKIDVAFMSCAGSVEVCKGGRGLAFDEEMAKSVLKEDEIIIKIDLNSGDCSARAWGCDLSYDYVKINGDYRT